MSRVKLKDVVMRVKDKVDKDNTELEFYVGGEHIDGNEICVTRKGIIQGSTIGPAFHMAFKAGDVLLMSRNPHLRKASMVDFDGICSDVSYICRTKDEGVLLQSYLPFLLQSDDFWRFAEENKKGGLPFFLNWSDFERYEFELPSIEKQRELSDLLWSMQRTKQAYQELLVKTDELVKSQFIEMFGDPSVNPNHHPVKRLADLGELNRGVSKSRPRNKPELMGGPYPLVQTGEVTAAELYITSYENTYSELGLAQSKMWPKGTLCITIAANIAQTAILGFDSCFPDSVVGFISGKEVTQIYVHYWFGFFQKILEEQAPKVAQKNINLRILSDLQVMVPPMELQDQFVGFVKQTDKSKFELKQNIENINTLMKSLMRQDFNS
jgi:type I restriction enzyme S subunit